MADGSVTVQVKGLAELGNALKQFPEVLGKKYLRRATYDAARLIADDAAAKAAGAKKYQAAMQQIAQNIAVFARRESNPNLAHYAVGVRRVRVSKKIKRVLRVLRKSGQSARIENDTFFWHWYEFGTAQRFTKSDGNRGRIEAQPYLRPAFEAQKANSVEKFKVSLAIGVQEAAAEVGAK